MELPPILTVFRLVPQHVEITRPLPVQLRRASVGLPSLDNGFSRLGNFGAAEGVEG